MKKLSLFLCLTGLCAALSAQNDLTMKTIHTDYGRLKGQTIQNCGSLHNAVIHPDTMQEFILLTTQVNKSQDTFSNCSFQQYYEVYFFSKEDSMLFSLATNSGMNKVMETILPGDTCHISMMSVSIPSIKSNLETYGVDWSKIHHWKLIIGFWYSDKEGEYSAKKLYANADTCIFQVVNSPFTAQHAVKLKTIRTEYGLFKGSSLDIIGALDGAVINPDSVPMLATRMHIVNTGNTTFLSTDKFRQTIIFYAYSENGQMLIDPDINESNTYQFMNDVSHGDTVSYGTMAFYFSDIRTAVGEQTWKKISYWKIVSGISYTSVDGTYPDSVFYASADTCTFRIVSNTGIRPVEKGTMVQCHPNPVRDRLTIRCEKEAIQGVTLFNALGETVRILPPCGTETVLQTTGLPRGLYLLKVETATGTAIRKIAIQ